MKKAISDFLCAFAIFGIILISTALLFNADFFTDSVSWNKDSLTLSLFDTDYILDSRVPLVLNELTAVNDMFFGKGFSEFIKNTAGFLGNLTQDILLLSYNFAKDITGAR